MPRYLFRVQYIYKDDSYVKFPVYESIAVDAATEADAEAEVDAATQRYPKLVGATKTLTLVLTV
jgi:hypothetical protein